ncbi:MAG: sugar ABC transporter permease [Anaerolineae bacterium]
MQSLTPVLVAVIAAVIGAVFMGTAFQGFGKRPALGAAIGAVAGIAGAMLFMMPLNFCTFNISPEEESATAQAIFGVILIGVGMLIVLLPVRWLAKNGLAGLSAGQSSQGVFSGRLTPWLLLLPTLLILIFFLYYPFLDTFRLSTLLASRTRSISICTENFTNLVTDQLYLNAVLRTFVFSGAIVIIGLSLSLGIAMLAFQPIKWASIYRTFLIWPHAISPVVAGVIFRLMFNPQGGVINFFTQRLFGVQFPWLNEPGFAPFVVIGASIWTQAGFNILFYIAGLQSIPKDMIEAASIDGANGFQRFWSIMLPMLSPITFFLIITNITFSFFDTFGSIDYLTEGGPLHATTTMIYNVFETQRGNIGLGAAAAQSLVLFFVVVALTLLQFRTTERNVNYGA